MAGIGTPWRKPEPCYSPILYWGFLNNIKKMEPASSCGRFLTPCQCKTLPELVRFNSPSLSFDTHFCQHCYWEKAALVQKKQLSSHLGAPSHPCKAEAADWKGLEPHLLSVVTAATKHTTPRAPLLLFEICRVPPSPVSAKRSQYEIREEVERH